MGTKKEELPGELGPQLAIYHQRSLHARDLVSLYLPGGLLVLGPLAYGAYRANYAYSHFGPAAASIWSRPWYVFSLIALFFMILIALSWLRKSHRFIAIHQHGLRLALPRSQSFRWEQITGITTDMQQEYFLGIPVRNRSCAVLYPAAGRPVSISSFKDFSHLVAQIKNQLYPRLLPGLVVNFQAGLWLHFGPVSIQSSSCHIGSRQLRWEQVRQVAVSSGDLVVELEDRSKIRLPASEIPNLEILLQIIQTGVAA